MAWEALTSLPTTDRGFGSGAINGKFYEVVHLTARSYDPGTNAWTGLTAPPLDRQYMASGVYNNRLYLAGGQDASYQADARYYDPSSNTWTAVAAMPGGPRSQLRGAFIGSTFYAVGGTNGTVLTRVEAFDAAGGTWSTKTSMSTPRVDPGVAAYGGYLWVVGGWNSVSNQLNTVERYDPGSNTWTTMSGTMTRARDGLGVGVIGNKLYAAGGSVDGTGKGTVYFEVYNLDADTWTDISSTDGLAEARKQFADCVIGNSYYVAGGFGDGGLDILTHARYNVPLGSWRVGMVL